MERGLRRQGQMQNTGTEHKVASSSSLFIQAYILFIHSVQI